MVKELKGAQHGVRFVPRGATDPHICIQLLGEDDDNWFPRGDSWSSFWLDDLIATLQEAKAALEVGAVKGKWGYSFPEGG